MKKLLMGIFALGLPLILTGCAKAGSKGVSLSMIYGATAVLSLVLLIGCLCIDRKRDRWFLSLFSSVLVVNIGYFVLSVSRDLEQALLANRIAYLGSAFLPISMLMILLNITRLRYKRWLPALLLGLAAAVFLIAASPGYLDIYYQEATLVTIHGASALRKVYGPWHCVYAVYLFCCFSAMVAVIIHAAAKRKLDSTGHAVILAIAVLVNIGVWFAEQMTDLNFEFLSISYIISELFLMGLHLMVAENRRLKNLVTEKEQALSEAAAEISASAARKEQLTGAGELTADRVKVFADGLLDLTQTEKVIFDAYISRATTKEIMTSLCIKENTLKFHNKNIYQKLGVSSRKELLEFYKQLMADGTVQEAVDVIV